MASQGDLLMMRKHGHAKGAVGVVAHAGGDDDDIDFHGPHHRHQIAGTGRPAPPRPSVGDTEEFQRTLQHSSRTERSSYALVQPTSGQMRASVASLSQQQQQQQPTLSAPQLREEQGGEMVAAREVLEGERLASIDEARRAHFAMLRERERMRMRQRAEESRRLEEKTRPQPPGVMTVAARERDALQLVAHRATLDSSRDRMEIRAIRRQEERDAVARRSEKRRDLEGTLGTTFAKTQQSLWNTIGGSAGGGALAACPTPVDAVRQRHVGEEEAWRAAQESADVDRAMEELDALDEQLYEEEKIRQTQRLARKQALREASRTRK